MCNLVKLCLKKSIVGNLSVVKAHVDWATE